MCVLGVYMSVVCMYFVCLEKILHLFTFELGLNASFILLFSRVSYQFYGSILWNETTPLKRTIDM
jgi:hypothetical protein